LARQEQHREDLLAEATALVERVELELPGQPEHVVAGFRREGAASIYFGEEPAYHFNTLGELRRAYDCGRLYKSEAGKLVSLDRQRGGGQVTLLRHDLDRAASELLLTELIDRLRALLDALHTASFYMVGQQPVAADVVGRLRSWLESLDLHLPSATIRLADSPRVC
jgi:hypothetical protein